MIFENYSQLKITCIFQMEKNKNAKLQMYKLISKAPQTLPALMFIKSI